MNTLEVGMVIYRKDYFGELMKYTITKLTATQVVANAIQGRGEVRFNREAMTHSKAHGFRARGMSSSACYYLETPELKARYEHQSSVMAFSTIKPNKLSTDQLQRIIVISKEKGE